MQFGASESLLERHYISTTFIKYVIVFVLEQYNHDHTEGLFVFSWELAL